MAEQAFRVAEGTAVRKSLIDLDPKPNPHPHLTLTLTLSLSLTLSLTLPQVDCPSSVMRGCTQQGSTRPPPWAGPLGPSTAFWPQGLSGPQGRWMRGRRALEPRRP